MWGRDLGWGLRKSPMHTYIIRRLLLTIVVVLGVTLLTFLSIHLAGDPTFFYVSERASAEERQAARERLGFDRPLLSLIHI